MDRTGVRSTNIVAIGWEANEDGASEGTLEVEFKAGVVYQYVDVPQFIYEQFLYSSSPGRYLLTSIVNAYDGQRIE